MGRMACNAICGADHKTEPFATLGREARVRCGYAVEHTPEPTSGGKAVRTICVKRDDDCCGRNKFSLPQHHGIDRRWPIAMAGIQSVRG